MVGVICTVEKKQSDVVTVLLGQLPKGWRKKINQEQILLNKKTANCLYTNFTGGSCLQTEMVLILNLIR